MQCSHLLQCLGIFNSLSLTVIWHAGAIAEQKREDDALQRVSARKMNGFAQFDKEVQQQQAQPANAS